MGLVEMLMCFFAVFTMVFCKDLDDSWQHPSDRSFQVMNTRETCPFCRVVAGGGLSKWAVSPLQLGYIGVSGSPSLCIYIYTNAHTRFFFHRHLFSYVNINT